VAFSVERAFIVWFPLQRSTVTSSRRTKMIGTLFILALMSTIHVVILIQIYITDFDSLNCYYYSEDNVLRLVLWVTDNTLFNFMPAITIFISNIHIVVGIYKSQTVALNKQRQKDAQETKIAVSLMLISTFYIIFMCPSAIIWTIYNGPLTFGRVNPQYMAIVFEIAKFLEAVTLLNYSTNFVIYGISLPYFRTEVAKICSCSK
jgi:hypothetical protein